MCGGSPDRRASVAKSLRKSWGVNTSGLFDASGKARHGKDVIEELP